MLKKNNLQKKIFGAVCIASGAMIFAAAFLVIWFEQDRCRKEKYNHIFHSTLAVKNMVIGLKPALEPEYFKKVLTQIVSADPDILYFVLTDKNGGVLVSDIKNKKEDLNFEIATIKQISHPLVETVYKKDQKMSARFVVYASRLNQDIFKNSMLKAARDEQILDAFWDIAGTGPQLGVLRIGFSMERLKQYLFFVSIGITVCSFMIFFAVAGVAFWILRHYFRSLEDLSLTIHKLNTVDAENNLKQNLAMVQFRFFPKEFPGFLNLKQVFSKLIKRISRNWDQLEDQVHDLENRLYKEQKALGQVKRDLVRQKEERKEIENRLLNVQKLEAVGTLAGGIAHEFNNLFMAITGYASLIQKQSEIDHPNAQKAKKILDLVNKGSQSVKQLLGFARSGKYTPGPLNMNDVIWATLEMFKKTRKDLLINAKYTQGLWPIYADRSQVEHIIMNLLLNAAEAMPETGQVDISTHNILLEKKKVGMDKIVSGRFVHFSIQDQGKGIETKYLRRVFDPFFTTKPFSSSSGMGLASVYGIVDNHGGFTTVESTLGKGTVFNVFLPAFKEEKNEQSI